MKVGFVVNPVAGMGGEVGLKGTDGPEILREALARGAEAVAPKRAVAALSEIKKRRLDLEFLTASGAMGQRELEEAGLEFRTTVTAPSKTGREDTVRAVRSFIDEGAELIVFAGGDGTARDVLSVADATVPMLGIPAGVKMHSSVFAITPEKAADAVAAFASGGSLREAEVMDVDEEVFREGVLRARLYGIAKVPDDAGSLQATKDAYHTTSADEEADEIGKYIAETMEPGTYYVLGPGTTTAAVARHLGIAKTVLGVDVVLDRTLALKDAASSDLLGLKNRPVRIIVSPIGAQGFFFGRGNQQISPSFIERVGTGNVIVIATPTKLKGTPVLRVDTGDRALDRRFHGHIKVVVGYGRRKLAKVA